jgi:hypothetical protein
MHLCTGIGDVPYCSASKYRVQTIKISYLSTHLITVSNANACFFSFFSEIWMIQTIFDYQETNLVIVKICSYMGVKTSSQSTCNHKNKLT